MKTGNLQPAMILVCYLHRSSSHGKGSCFHVSFNILPYPLFSSNFFCKKNVFLIISPSSILYFLFIYLSTYLSVYLSIYLSTYLSIYVSIYLSIYISTYLSIYLSRILSVYFSISTSNHLSLQ